MADKNLEKAADNLLSSIKKFEGTDPTKDVIKTREEFNEAVRVINKVCKIRKVSLALDPGINDKATIDKYIAMHSKKICAHRKLAGEDEDRHVGDYDCWSAGTEEKERGRSSCKNEL